MLTLYQLADAEIRECIRAYLELMSRTENLAHVEPTDLVDERARMILLGGLGLVQPDCTPEEASEEWQRRSAIPFDLEAGVTVGVYRNIRNMGVSYLDDVERITDCFRRFEPDFINANPHLLPIFQHLSGVFSKANLKKQVGSVSDTHVSKPAAQRLADLLAERVVPGSVDKGQVLQRLESTLEGIVRDLVGRVLLESIVESALLARGVPFMAESDYQALPGVIYDFRADFVIPSSEGPLAFIEVRKSSSRHASLYAKDKMFSAINWKGYNQRMLAVLVVDGEWTGETLRVMAKVFDYVVPIGRVAQLADTIAAYLSGDISKLKWLVDFRIRPAQDQSHRVTEGVGF